MVRFFIRASILLLGLALLIDYTVAPVSAESAHLTQFDPSSVHIVQRGASYPNFLVRGNLFISGPAGHRHVAYQQLMNAIRQQYIKQGMRPFPKHFVLIDISLLSHDGPELPDLTVERVFWQQHPGLGQFNDRFPIEVPRTEPKSFYKVLRPYIANHFVSSIKGLIPALEAEMNTPARQGDGTIIPKFIYIHCRDGINRTGQAIGAYYMQALQLDYSTALARVQREGGIGDRAIYSMQWYALYLRDYLNIASVGQIINSGKLSRSDLLADEDG